MSELSILQCTTKAEFNPASLTGTYQPLNGAGFSDAIKILKIYNPSTTASIDISLDGVEDHDFIPPMGTLIVDVQTNHASGASFGCGVWRVSKYQVLYGKTAANPTFLQMVGYY